MDFERIGKWDHWGEPRVAIELTNDELESEIDNSPIIERKFDDLEDVDPYHL